MCISCWQQCKYLACRDDLLTWLSRAVIAGDKELVGRHRVEDLQELLLKVIASYDPDFDRVRQLLAGGILHSTLPTSVKRELRRYLQSK